jgi:hypothetical protein
MRRGAPFKIVTGRRKQAILPCCKYFAAAVRFVKAVYRLRQFLELLRPGCGLSTYDQLERALSL